MQGVVSRRPRLRRALPMSATVMERSRQPVLLLPADGVPTRIRQVSRLTVKSEALQPLCLPRDGQLCTTWVRGAVDYRGTSARSSTDRASDYGSFRASRCANQGKPNKRTTGVRRIRRLKSVLWAPIFDL